MGKRATLAQQASLRLKALDSRGVKRKPLKVAAQDAAEARGEPRPWSVSTGRIHSDSTQQAYDRVVRAYARWCRVQGVRDLDEMDRRAPELVKDYLEMKKASTTRDRHGNDTGRHYSAWSLAQYRSALRMYYHDRVERGRELGEDVQLPQRKREKIRNNRHVDLTAGGHVDPERHAALIEFLACSGLREREIRALRCKHIEVVDAAGETYVTVHITNGKGGKKRDVIPLGDHGWIADLVTSRSRHDLVFPTVPENLPIHVIRRLFAQKMYCDLSGRELPCVDPPRVRLSRKDYDLSAVLKVSAALGHNRRDVVLTNYLR